MAKKKAKVKKAPEQTFEESLEKLEQVVADLEGGELGLSEALASYEEGVTKLKQCHAQLESAQRRIDLLRGFDADGNPVTEPFDDAPTTDTSTRSKKRSTSKTPPTEGTGVDDSTRLF